MWKEALVVELWMNKIRTRWKAQVRLLVLHTHRARYLTDDTQPSYVRQPVGSAAWLGLGKVEEGSAFRSLGPRPACRKARTFRKIRISRILCTPSEGIRQSLRGSSQLPSQFSPPESAFVRLVCRARRTDERIRASSPVILDLIDGLQRGCRIV